MNDLSQKVYNLDELSSDQIHRRRDNSPGVLSDRSWRLSSKEKTLLWMILDQGASYGQIARISGEHASTVSRRFRSMVTRLRGRRGSEQVLEALTAVEKTILIESHLCGTPQHKIAAKLGISRYRVRKALCRFAPGRAKNTSAAGGVHV